MITRINEANTLIKHISCVCECKFDSAICNSNQKLNNDKCQCFTVRLRTKWLWVRVPLQSLISIYSLLVYENKFYLQVYLENCAYKTVDKRMIDYLGDTAFETDED